MSAIVAENLSERWIIAEAPGCLMDEPPSNLDAQLRQDMRGESAGYAPSAATTSTSA